VNATTKEDIDNVTFGDLEAMNDQIKSVKATHILMKNITDFKENCKQSLEKRDSLTLKERMQMDNKLLQNLTNKLESKVEIIKNQLEEKENEIKQLKEQIREHPNQQNLQALLDHKRAEYIKLKSST